MNKCGQIIGVNTFTIYSATEQDVDGPQVKTDFALPAADPANFLNQENITLADSNTRVY